MSHLPPDPDEMNDARADWAHEAIDKFQETTCCDDEDALGDLLCNLMHWCDRYGQDFDRALERARMHYAAETDPEGGL